MYMALRCAFRLHIRAYLRADALMRMFNCNSFRKLFIIIADGLNWNESEIGRRMRVGKWQCVEFPSHVDEEFYWRGILAQTDMHSMSHTWMLLLLKTTRKCISICHFTNSYKVKICISASFSSALRAEIWMQTDSHHCGVSENWISVFESIFEGLIWHEKKKVHFSSSGWDISVISHQIHFIWLSLPYSLTRSFAMSSWDMKFHIEFNLEEQIDCWLQNGI